MSNKIALLMFAAIVLLASTTIMTVSQANALTQAVVRNYISTAGHGNSLVCGDHICSPGEHTKWVNGVWQSQKVGYGKVGKAPHGEDVMNKMAESTTMHGNATMSENMTVSGISTTPTKTK